MWYVYLLLCEDKSIYTGITNDLKKRLSAHKAGKGASYTRSHKPVRVLYSEKLRTRGAALRREAEIKKLGRTNKLKLINQHKRTP